MDLALQGKLLRFIQTGTFQPVGSGKLMQTDVRFVCATNRDPLEEVRAGRFREDLYYRLHVIPVPLPPLRDRGDDVLTLAEAFLAKSVAEEGKRFQRFDTEARATLLRHAWPGNVRELENAIRTAVVLHDGEVVSAGMLPARVRVAGAKPAPVPAPPPPPEPEIFKPAVPTLTLRAAETTKRIRPLAETEREAIEEAVAISQRQRRFWASALPRFTASRKAGGGGKSLAETKRDPRGGNRLMRGFSQIISHEFMR
jgi:two-component system repressor protein LuxO